MFNLLTNKKDSIFKPIAIVLLIIGLLLILLSRTVNLFFLFSGIGFIIVGMTSLIIKSFAYTFLLPVALIIVGGSFVINSLDFQANLFHVDFSDQTNYTAIMKLKYDVDVAGELEERSFLPGNASPHMRFGEATQMQIYFEKLPDLTDNDFILTDFLSTEAAGQLVWHWSGDSQWFTLNNADFLQIYDTDNNLIYPSFDSALSLHDNIEFSVVQIDQNRNQFITQLGLDEIHFQTKNTHFQLNSPLKYLILETSPEKLAIDFNIMVNGEFLTHERSENNRHYFSSNKILERIEQIQITENIEEIPQLIQTLQPGFDSLLLIETEPAQITIQSLSLHKYFGSIGRTLTFYQWNGNELASAFRANNNSISAKNGNAYLQPEGDRFAIDSLQPPSTIATQGLSKFQPYILGANLIFITTSFLSYILISQGLNRYWCAIKQSALNINEIIKRIGNSLSKDWTINRLTPFKIIFGTWLFVSWLILLNNPVNPIWIGISLVLSLASAYYVFRDLEFNG